MINWQTTIKEYGPLVWKIVYRLLGNEADANDCFQEVFLDPFKTAKKQKIKNMPGFLTTLSTQRAIDILRQRKRRLRIAANAIDFDTMESNSLSPSQDIIASELSDQLQVAMTKIPRQEAAAFCLKSFDKFSYRQIAEEMNVTENYAGVLINRARTKLQNILKQITATGEREVAHE